MITYATQIPKMLCFGLKWSYFPTPLYTFAILNTLTNSLKLSQFLELSPNADVADPSYILTSFIANRNNHFFVYFRMAKYEEGVDWYRINDENLDLIGKWDEVVEECIENN